MNVNKRGDAIRINKHSDTFAPCGLDLWPFELKINPKDHHVYRFLSRISTMHVRYWCDGYVRICSYRSINGDQIRPVNPCGRGAFILRGSATPHPQGRGPSALKSLTHIRMPTPFDAEWPNSACNPYVEEWDEEREQALPFLLGHYLRHTIWLRATKFGQVAL